MGLSNIVGSVVQGENEQEAATLKIPSTAPNCVQVSSDFLASIFSLLYFVVKLRNHFGTKASWWGEAGLSTKLMIRFQWPCWWPLKFLVKHVISDMGLSCCELKLGIEGPGAGGFTLDG